MNTQQLAGIYIILTNKIVKYHFITIKSLQCSLIFNLCGFDLNQIPYNLNSICFIPTIFIAPRLILLIIINANTKRYLLIYNIYF